MNPMSVKITLIAWLLIALSSNWQMASWNKQWQIKCQPKHFVDISIIVGVTVKVSIDDHSRSTLFSPEKNRTGVIKFIILVWPEGRILGRVWERGVGDQPVYKPYSRSGTSYQLETSVRQHESVLGRYRAVKVLCPVWPALAPVPWPVRSRASLWDCDSCDCLILLPHQVPVFCLNLLIAVPI